MTLNLTITNMTDLENITETESASTIYYPFVIELSDILVIIFCIIGTAIDLLIIYILTKYKNLRKPVNLYILNWLICDAALISVDPSSYMLYYLLENIPFGPNMICTMFSLTAVIRSVGILFMIALLFQWFLINKTKQFFSEHCGKIILLIWLVGLLESAYSIGACSTKTYISYLVDIQLLVLYLFFIVCFLVVHCMRKCSNPFSISSSLPIALITSYILCWCVPILFSLLKSIFWYNTTITIFYFVTEVGIYLYPMLLFYLFYKIDKQFSICVKVLLGCSRNRDEVNAWLADTDEDFYSGEESGKDHVIVTTNNEMLI